MPALAEILKQVPDSFLAAEVKRRRKMRSEPQCLAVLTAVSTAWGVKPDEIRHDHTRAYSTLHPRQAAMVIMRGMGIKLACIGGFFGMGHANVIWAVKKHPRRMARPSYAARFNTALELSKTPEPQPLP